MGQKRFDPDLEIIQQAFGAYEKAGILGVELLLKNKQTIRELEAEADSELVAKLMGEQS